MITCHNVFNVWPKTTLLFLVWPETPKGWILWASYSILICILQNKDTPTELLLVVFCFLVQFIKTGEALGWPAT